MWYRKLSVILASIGALNWGATAFGYNLVEKFLGAIPLAVTAVYVVVAIAGIVCLASLKHCY